jgi:adenylate cyclase class 2
MKEVEIKFKAGDLESLKTKLEALGFVLKAPLKQEDIIFIPEDEPTVPVRAGINVLRIRKQSGEARLTLKQSDKNNHLSKLEHEIKIFDAEVAEKIITCLKFKEMARVQKIRTTAKNQEYEVCLDEVEGLGNFIEVEKITDEDPQEVQARMLEFVRTLGIDPANRVHFGYDILMVQKNAK